MFSRFPFFYRGNLEKTKIRRGKIFPMTSQEQLSKQNVFSIFMVFSCAFFTTYPIFLLFDRVPFQLSRIFYIAFNKKLYQSIFLHVLPIMAESLVEFP